MWRDVECPHCELVNICTKDFRILDHCVSESVEGMGRKRKRKNNRRASAPKKRDAFASLISGTMRSMIKEDKKKWKKFKKEAKKDKKLRKNNRNAVIFCTDLEEMAACL